MPRVKIPSNPAEPDGVWKPRDYQEPIWQYLMDGGKRAIEIDHRRAGKDELCLAWTCVAAHRRVGTYWHMLPEAAQARKAIWEAVDPHRGKRRIDLAFPQGLRETTRDQEMFIRFKNGSTWQVVGSDNFDSLVGTPPVGLVFSEAALGNPYAWSYLRPILLENGGWAVFITTPRGRNHTYKMFNHALKSPDWFANMNKATDTGVFTPEQLEAERQEYIDQYGEVMGNALFDQEYLCSWEAATPGAYWGTELNDLERDGRLTKVPYDPDLPVITSSDLGMNDETVVFYWQVAGPQVRMIDVDVYRGTGLLAQIKERKGKPYMHYAGHIYPHDVQVRELGTGKSRKEVLENNGIRVTVAPKIPVMDGIDAFRRIISRMWVDEEKCGDAFETLKQYRAEWDDKNQVLRKNPLHNFASNWADSCRYFAVTPTPTDEWTEIDYTEQHRATGWL